MLWYCRKWNCFYWRCWMNRRFQAERSGRARGKAFQVQGNGVSKDMKVWKARAASSFSSFCLRKKNRAGDVRAPGSVRPAGQAAFLGHEHFKANRLLELPQTEKEIKSIWALCPKVPRLQARRILMVSPEPWDDECESAGPRDFLPVKNSHRLCLTLLSF